MCRFVRVRIRIRQFEEKNKNKTKNKKQKAKRRRRRRQLKATAAAAAAAAACTPISTDFHCLFFCFLFVCFLISHGPVDVVCSGCSGFVQLCSNCVCVCFLFFCLFVYIRQPAPPHHHRWFCLVLSHHPESLRLCVLRFELIDWVVFCCCNPRCAAPSTTCRSKRVSLSDTLRNSRGT